MQFSLQKLDWRCTRQFYWHCSDIEEALQPEKIWNCSEFQVLLLKSEESGSDVLGVGVVIQVSLLNWGQWWVPEWWWIYSLRLFDQNMLIHNGDTLKMEINGQTIDDGVRHSCRFLCKSVCFEKFAYNPLTAWKVKAKDTHGWSTWFVGWNAV